MSLPIKWNPFRSEPWDPFRELRDLERRLGSFYGPAAANPTGSSQETMTVAQWAPLVDITEDDKEFLVKAELPEIRKEDVKVSVEDGILTISGERKVEKEEKDRKYHRLERSYGAFERSFSLPEGTDGSKVSADFRDGILRVRLPKSEKAKPKAIEVKVG